MNAPTPSSTASATEIRKTLSTMYPNGGLVEVRVPSKYPLSGYFSDHEALAAAIEKLSGEHTAIYVLLNEFQPSDEDLTPRHNKVITCTTATKDSEVTRRRWLLIDIDPQRLAGTSASEMEKAEALGKMQAVGSYLTSLGWPTPVSADSGNGYHLLYALDLPNTKEVTAAVRGLINALADKFDTETVKVDRSVYNAARITKAYGTLVCKGESTSERPHRVSCLRKVPAVLTPVTMEQMTALIPVKEPKESKSTKEPKVKETTKTKGSGLVIKAPAQTKSAYDPITPTKIESCLDFYKIDWTEVTEHTTGQLKWMIECPWKEDHSDGRLEASVFLTDGIPGFKCFHSHCVNKGWKEFRAHLEALTDGKFWFNDNTPDVVQPSAPTTSSLALRPFDAIKAEAIQWLWPGVVAIGKLTLFVGNPGVGKGLVTMDIAARVTTQDAWPNCPNTNAIMDVLIVSSEDAPEDTLKPRLMAAGADQTHVFNIDCTKTETGEKMFSLDTDLPALRKTLEENPTIKLLIIDPVMSHLGGANGNREQELRNVLGPLGDLANQFKSAIILVAHFNKRADADTIARVGGAMAMVGVVRTAWTFTESKEQEGRVMLPLKSNLSKDDGGFNYDTIGVPVEVTNHEGKIISVDIGKVKWGEKSSEKFTSGSVEHGAAPKPKNLSKVQQAMVWLSDTMTVGVAYPVEDITQAGEAAGFTYDNLYEARKKLGVTTQKQGTEGWFITLGPKPKSTEAA